jgi:hypothetical protein
MPDELEPPAAASVQRTNWENLGKLTWEQMLNKLAVCNIALSKLRSSVVTQRRLSHVDTVTVKFQAPVNVTFLSESNHHVITSCTRILVFMCSSILVRLSLSCENRFGIYQTWDKIGMLVLLLAYCLLLLLLLLPAHALLLAQRKAKLHWVDRCINCSEGETGISDEINS